MTLRPIAVFLVMALGAAPVAAQERMTPELLWKLKRVSDPQPNPAIAGHLLYTVRESDLAKNKGTSQVMFRDVKSCLLYTSPSPRDS